MDAELKVAAGYTSFDQDQGGHDEWSPADIAARVALGDPEGLAHVLRATAAQLADAAGPTGGRVTDPRTVLLDLGRAADSMAAAVRAVIVRDELHSHDDEGVQDQCAEAMTCLLGASAALDGLSGTY
jgi:hypothetical protein